MLETAADRAAYVADFGVPVTGAASFNAIFDNEYVEIGDINGTRPVLSAAYVSPVSTLAVGDALTVSGINYTVIRVESDATGWAVIVLEKA
jgi:hypothetical protein